MMVLEKCILLLNMLKQVYEDKTKLKGKARPRGDKIQVRNMVREDNQIQLLTKQIWILPRVEVRQEERKKIKVRKKGKIEGTTNVLCKRGWG